MNLVLKAYKGKRKMYEKSFRSYGAVRIAIDEALINEGANKIVVEKIPRSKT